MIHNLRADIERMTDFPAMPELARKILALRSEPSARELAAVVELDPGIAGQLVRHAMSPFFGYGGRINSICDAVARVLGVERALGIALGAASGRAFNGPAEGRLGRNAMWLHAVYCAALMQALAEAAKADLRLLPGVAYLCGLVHNIGLLLLGHLYPADIHALNQALHDDPEAEVPALERHLFWTDHMQLGGWLMQQWGMPAEVIATVQHHHHETYDGPHAAYVRLALIADLLIQRLEIGDVARVELPHAVLASMGMDEEAALTVFQRLLDSRADLDQLAECLASAA